MTDTERGMEHREVFLSYRRQPSTWVARSIFGALRQRGVDVFMDTESIAAGRVSDAIEREIMARDHFAVIIEPDTQIRFDDGQDWVAKELHYALELGKNVIPLFVNGASMDSVQLSSSLSRAFREVNGLVVESTYFEAAMDALVARFLSQPTLANERLRLSEEHWKAAISALERQDWRSADVEATNALACRNLPEFLLTRSIAREHLKDLSGALRDRDCRVIR